MKCVISCVTCVGHLYYCARYRGLLYTQYFSSLYSLQMYYYYYTT